MVPSAPPAERYRVVLDRTADHRYAARCAEVPDVTATALSAEAAIAEIRAALAGVVRDRAPAPLCDVEGPLGAWTADLELLDDVARPAAPDLEKPVPSALRAIAQWTAYRYRIVVEPRPDGRGFVANSPEMPEILAAADLAGVAASELQRKLADRAYAILDAGGVPPEPLQDVEARENAARQSRALRLKVA